MNLWQSFEIERCNCSNAGIFVRFETGVDVDFKKLCNNFLIWLRKKYAFPVKLTVYIKNCETVKLLNGRRAYGSFRWFPDKPPYIRVPAKINWEQHADIDKDEIYEMVLSSLVHELTHYFQWVRGLEQDDRTTEWQAGYYRYRIIDQFNAELK